MKKTAKWQMSFCFTCTPPTHFLHRRSSSASVWKQDVLLFCQGSSIMPTLLQSWAAVASISHSPFYNNWNRQQSRARLLHTTSVPPFVWKTLLFPFAVFLFPFFSFAFTGTSYVKLIFALLQISVPMFVQVNRAKQRTGFQNWIWGTKCSLIRHE